MKRLPLILVAVLGIGVVIGLVMMGDDGSGRSDRLRDRSEGLSERDSVSSEADRGEGAAGAIADAATLAKMIDRYGGFTSRGQLLLTRPSAPAVEFEVLFHTRLDGKRVEARVTSDAEGRFSIHRLPRGADYTLEVVGERIQPFKETVPDPKETELDLGELFLDRYYVLRGKVVASSGAAVNKAEVAIIMPSSGGFSMRSSSVNAGSDDPVAGMIETGPDGIFLLKLREPGIFTLRVRAEGWAPHYRGDVFVGAGGDTELKVALTRGVEVGGLVMDADGRPVMGATVSLFANGRQWWSQVKELQKTDDAGRFDFRIEPQTDRYNLRVLPPKGVDVNKSFRLPLTEDLIIQLPGGATLKGRVVDSDTSQPIAGAEVLLGIKGPGGSGWTPAYQKMLKTDSYGAYRLEGVGTDSIQSLAVSAPGYAYFAGGRWSRSPQWGEISKLKLDAADEIQIPDLPLKRGRVVEGTVRDEATGEPIAGATVSVRDWVLGNREYETDANGQYRITDVGERVALSAKAHGYTQKGDNPWRGADLPPDQEIVQRNFELQPAGTIAGKVITKAGVPVARALVRLRSGETGRAAWTSEMQVRDLYTHTNQKGEYRIEGAPPIKLKVEVKASGYDGGESSAKTLTSGGVIDDMNVTLHAAADLRGILVARGGGVVSGARVTVVKDPGEGADQGRRWRMWGGGTIAFTDEKGRFHAADVPVGDLLVRIEAEGLATETVSRRGVEPGEKITGWRITVRPALEITGKLLGPDGEPIMAAFIQAKQTASPDGEPSAETYGARVQAGGVFLIRNIPEGSYTLTVRTWGRDGGSRYEPLERPGVAAGTEGVTLQLVAKE